jgi:hypothetical protein
MLGGDLNPVSGFYFPLFSMVFPSEIAISVESGGFLRKQNCCKLLQIYVHFVGGLYLIKSLMATFVQGALPKRAPPPRNDGPREKRVFTPR